MIRFDGFLLIHLGVADEKNIQTTNTPQDEDQAKEPVPTDGVVDTKRVYHHE